MTDTDLKQFKNIYLKTPVPKDLAENGWNNVLHRLPKQETPAPSYWRYSFLSIAVFLIAFAGLISLSQTATSGSLLFPVRTMSESVTKAVNQSFEKSKLKTVNPTILPVENVTIKKTPTPTVTPTPTKKKEETRRDSERHNTGIFFLFQGKQDVKGEKTENKNRGKDDHGSDDHKSGSSHDD